MIQLITRTYYKCFLIVAISFGWAMPLWAENYIMNTSPQTTCSGTFYDPGYLGNYSDNLNIVQTFTPGIDGYKVSFTFSSFTLENSNDFLIIYDGPDTYSPLIGIYTGTTNPGT